ncbi:hypothetical protein TIFTF001_036910 [Ficus carica]|uniref:Ubiquitin-like protease family profile domain-containing protein n=1 Tax=Ficus carica TaxID=3494 RepID=A0AA88JBL0_FICCA|nr:hypothetical protein TIFTF001_036904 [Ficus carica]GMN67850.1 hypothetical protein TIFTF001_036910 [Ficus carica]
MTKKLEDLKKGQKKSKKHLRRVLKLFYNLNDNVKGNPTTTYHVSSRHKRNVQKDDSDALKTDSDDLQFGSQDDVFIDFDIGVVVDKDVKIVMEFFNSEKEEGDEEKEIAEDEDDKGENYEEILKMSRLSRLGQERSRPVIEIGSPAHAPTKVNYALLQCLSDEPPTEKLEEFREWIKKGLLKKPPQSAKIGALWRVYKKSPDKYDWGSCDSLMKIIYSVCIRCGLSWFEVNTLLIPMHLEDLKHRVLAKLDLLNWTIEVYDSLHHEGPHNYKVRETLECMSKFIPMLANRISLFEFKPRDPPGIYPIPVTIMQDIPRQKNG